jgi:hypothetical protein
LAKCAIPLAIWPALAVAALVALGGAACRAAPEPTPPAAEQLGGPGPIQPVTASVPAQLPAREDPPGPTGSHGLIRGRVTGPDGAPVGDATVVIVDGSAPGPEMAAFTSAAGEYLWLVDAGEYTLEASRDGVGTARGTVTTYPGREVRLDLQLAP